MEGLRAFGYKPEVQPLSFFEDDYGLKGSTEESSESEEEEEYDISDEDANDAEDV